MNFFVQRSELRERTSFYASSLILLICGFLLCSCITTPRQRPLDLPSAAQINPEAGRWGWIVLPLRLESGQELFFAVETGCPFSLLDKSLEPALGTQIGSKRIRTTYGPFKTHIYKAPELYLGDVLLHTGETIGTMDFTHVSEDYNRITRSNRKISGFLGMDCLRHYCIQLDFTKREMRFLDPEDCDDPDLGREFPLAIFFGEVKTRSDFGIKDLSMRLDTGANMDGALKQNLFSQLLQQPGATLTNGAVLLPGSFINGRSYTNLIITPSGKEMSSQNLLGLRFLARHLVTLNFPKRKMYLKQVNVGPLAAEINSSQPQDDSQRE